MGKYILDCFSYTEECFELVLQWLELIDGAKATIVDKEVQNAILEFDNLEVEKIVKRTIQLGELGEIYKTE